MSRSIVLRCGLTLGIAGSLASGDLYWHGYGHHDHWGNPLAWDQNAVPGSADDALLTYGISLLEVPGSAEVGTLILDTYVPWGPPGEIQLHGNTLTVLNGGEWQWGGFGDYYNRSGTVNLFGEMVLVDDIADHYGNGDAIVDPVNHSVSWDVTVNNYGTMRHEGNGFLQAETFLNAGIYRFVGDGDITDIGHGGETMTNTGLVTKEAGEGLSRINPVFSNETGAVEAHSGTLQIRNAADISGSTLTAGDWLAANGATLELEAQQPLQTNQASITIEGADSSLIVKLLPIEETLTTNQGHLTVIGDRAFTNDLHNTLRVWIGAGTTLTGSFTNDGWIGVTRSPGLAVIEGDVTFGSSGKFDLSLGGTIPEIEHDVIEVTGTLAADNAIVVRREGDFDPLDYPIGTRFEVIRAPQITGAFERVVYADGSDSYFDVIHEPGPDGMDIVAVVIVHRGCLGADLAPPEGVLDLNDVVAFVAAFGAASADADIAEPFGVLDLADVLLFIDWFLAGCP